MADRLNEMGLVELRRGNYESAIKKFEEALEADPLLTRALINLDVAKKKANVSSEDMKKLGLDALGKGDFELAIKKLNEALEKNPDDQETKDALKSASEQAQSIDVYLADMTRRIKRAWFPGHICVEHPAPILTFRLHADGSVSDIILKQSSTFKMGDDACFAAVRNAAPFRRLPQGKDTLDIQFTFDYNLFGHPKNGVYRKF